MAQSQNTVRELILGTAIASETTLDTFKATASDGEIGVFTSNGTALAAGTPFVVAQKTADGVFVSDVILPKNVKKVSSQVYAAEQLRSVAVGDISVTVGNDYIVDLHIYEHGSLSREDVYIKFGAYRAVTGDTASTIVDGLIASLNRNFSREPGASPSANPIFTFSKGFGTQTLTVTAGALSSANATVTINGQAITVALLNADSTSAVATKIAAAVDATPLYVASAVGAVVTITAADGAPVSTVYAAGTTGTAATIAGTASDASLVITAKAQPYLRGKKFGRGIFFDVLPKFDPATGTAVVIAGGNPGKGTGKLVSAMEFDLRKNRGDMYGDKGWPYTFPVTTRASEAGQYDLIDILHTKGHDGWNDVAMRKVTTLAFTTGGGRLATLLASIATAVG